MSRRAPTRDREDYSHHSDPKPVPPRERSASPPRNLIKMKMKPLDSLSGIGSSLSSSLSPQPAGDTSVSSVVGSAASPVNPSSPPPPPASTPSSTRIDVAKAAAAATESATASIAEALMAGPPVDQLPPRRPAASSSGAPTGSASTTTLPPASSLTPAPASASASVSASASSAAAAAATPEQPRRLRVNVDGLNISPADAARINLRYLQEHFREPYHRHPRWQTEEGKAKKSQRKQVRCANCKRRCSTYCPGCSEEKVTGFCGVNIKSVRHCFEEYHIKLLVEQAQSNR